MTGVQTCALPICTAAISQARAELQTAVIKYNYSVQDALQEVDVAIADYNNSVIQLSDIRTATYAAEKSMKLSLRLYKDGLSDYYNVLDSQKTLLTYQLSLLSTEGSMLNALISLYSALGGGWPINEGK